MDDVPYRSLETALAVVAYEWAMRGEPPGDEIAAVEALQAAAAALPQEHVPLAELYPQVARIAALSVRLLAALGHPDEVDRLRGYEGFSLWRQSRSGGTGE